jgi:hypothetical protein
VRYDVHLSKGETKRRVEIDIDVQFKPTDEFRYGPDIYVVTSVRPGNDEFGAILFADLSRADPSRRDGDA